MTDIAKTGPHEMKELDSLAAQARVYSESLAMNMFQLGRVFAEAKALVPHGEWGEWVHSNGGMSERAAQQLMQVYARFGSNPTFAGIEKSKLIKMLSLPAGTEETFVEDHEVNGMTSRAVEEAVKRERENAQKEIAGEKALRKAAEQRAEELAQRPPSMPGGLVETMKAKEDEIQRFRSEVERLEGTARELMAENKAMGKEHREARRDLAETEAMLREKQEEYNSLQNELLNAQSAAARGDAERTPNHDLTADVLAGAVRQLIGTCAQMPLMARMFADMDAVAVCAFDKQLRTLEDFVKSAREALDTVTGEVIEP